MMKNVVAQVLVFASVVSAQAEDKKPKSISPADEAKYFDVSYRKDGKYTSKPDFAQLEYTKPLNQAFLKRLTVDNMLAMDQEMADQLYARLPSGPIPNGVYDGYPVVLKDSAIKNLISAMTGEQGRLLFRPLSGDQAADFSAEAIEKLASIMWKGKEFFKSERVLRNIIPKSDATARAFGLLIKGFDANQMKAQDVFIHGQNIKAWKMFPARLYCGQSLIDSRRESVIIDYAYSDRLPDYYDAADFLASRHGIYIRDEIRMVRPGLYLGKAYMNRMFLLTFILNNPEVEKNSKDEWRSECWTGTQQQRVTAR